ncbi:MAG TPA: TRZ/ATZ family hydrolase [Steroidobacteraceae bacterium]|nr:TRZ/ATZ family hydrolase [Steroidobacteraceae bacterium]
MESIDLLITARWIIPIEPSDVVLDNHAIAIRGGRILAVLPTAEAVARYSPSERIDRSQHVLLPGLVNAHTHVGMTLLRGAAENLPFDAWLKETIWPLEKRWLDPEFVRDGTELAIAGMIASGTTCFSEQYFFPEVIAQTSSQMHMRACVGSPVIDFATVWAGSANECLDKALKLHDEYRDDPLITTAFAPHAVYSVAESALTRMRRATDEIEMPIAMHLHESANEVAVAERPIAGLDRLGFLTPAFSGVHMTQLNADDIERVVRGGINVIHCPQSNLKLDNGVCPVATLVNRGVNVALGTDSAASNNDLDMMDELRTAALLAGTKLTAHQWLRIATLNGARSLNLSDAIGSLNPGKWADVCCIDLHDIHAQPIHDPVTAIVYSANRSNVSDVWIAGRQLLADRKLTHYDTPAIVARAYEWQQRISSRT